MKRKDEEFCKLRFNEYVSRLSPSELIQWEDVPRKEEPPDFYLHLDGIKYAVEVTDIVELIDVGTARKLPRNVANSFLVKFVGEIEKEAKKNRWLSGTYMIRFHRFIKNLSEVEAELREQMLNYIQVTNELDSEQALHFFIGYEQFCEIYKKDNEKDVIYPGLPGSAKFEGQSTKDSQILLEERLQDKKNKLRNLSSPVILLILDTNSYYPNNQAFLESIPLLFEATRFHTVFIVSPNFGDFLLYSESSEWR